MANSSCSQLALVTGITGQDGYYLASHLANLGYLVVGTSRSSNSHPRLEKLIDSKSLVLEKLDLLDVNAVQCVINKYKPKSIFHLAGQSSVGMSFEDPEGTFSSIVTTTRNLLDAIRQQSPRSRIFIAGSSEIFGINQKEPVTCSTSTNPQNPYGTAKADAFHLVRDFRKVHSIYACTGVLFSHESPLRPQHFVSQKIIRGACAIAKGEQDKLHLGNLSTKRDWGWAPEYVKAMEKMLIVEEPRDFILATGKLNQLEAFVAQAFAAVGLDWQKYVVIDEQLFRPNDGSHPLADTKDATQYLGWTATTTMTGVVKNMVDACQSHVRH